MPQFLFIPAAILVALIVLGFIWTRLYRRAPKDAALIRTGFGGEKVIINGGIMVLPVLHDIAHVSLTTIKLRTERTKHDSLLTKDKIRVDVIAQFHIRVAPRAEAISAARQTLGQRINEEAAVSALLEAKLVSSLRSVAATMTMEDLHANRTNFQQEVEKSLVGDLAKNGFELETVSITDFNQTKIEYLDENNAFDAEGLTEVKKITENRRRLRNEIEAENRVAIEQRNFEANQQSLEIQRQDEFATMTQQREIATARAENDAKTQAEIAQREQEAEAARISAKQATDTANLAARQTLEQREIERQRATEIARQEQQIAIQNKSRDESVARAEADAARASAVAAEESVITARETAQAERSKAIAVIEASQEAEQKAVGVTVQAEAEKRAAADRAEALRTQTTAEAEAAITKARGEADAKLALADAAERTYAVEAEGERLRNEAKNLLTGDQMAFEGRLRLIDALPAILREQAKPMEKIDSIRIVDMGGRSVGDAVSGGGAANQQGGNLADQAVTAALRYRMNAPMLSGLVADAFSGDPAMSSMISAFAGEASQTAAAPTSVAVPPAVTQQGPLPIKAADVARSYDGEPEPRRRGRQAAE